MWWVPLIPIGWWLADEFDKARERERKKKRKKKEQRRAEAERQRQIALQRQAAEERQRRSVEEEKHKILASIECYKDTLPENYREAIMQKFYDTYSKSNNLEELQEILEDVKQFRLADSLLHSIKSCPLSKRLRELTDERVELADFNADELQRIKKEVSCACKIEQCAQELGEQKFQGIYEKLEYAYEKRDFDMLQAMLTEVRS